MMNNDFILSKLGEVRRNPFIIEFELGLLTHNLVLSGNAKIDTGCENTSIALQSPSIGIDKRTAFAYKKQAIEANLNMSLGFGANDTKMFRREQRDLFRCGDFIDCSVLKFDVPVTEYSIKVIACRLGISGSAMTGYQIKKALLQAFLFCTMQSLATIPV